jgi:hypothetical protein
LAGVAQRYVWICRKPDWSPQGPVMGVLWHTGVAPVDDPFYRGSAEGSQHQIPPGHKDGSVLTKRDKTSCQVK